MKLLKQGKYCGDWKIKINKKCFIVCMTFVEFSLQTWPEVRMLLIRQCTQEICKWMVTSGLLIVSSSFCHFVKNDRQFVRRYVVRHRSINRLKHPHSWCAEQGQRILHSCHCLSSHHLGHQQLHTESTPTAAQIQASKTHHLWVTTCSVFHHQLTLWQQGVNANAKTSPWAFVKSQIMTQTW